MRGKIIAKPNFLLSDSAARDIFYNFFPFIQRSFKTAKKWLTFSQISLERNLKFMETFNLELFIFICLDIVHTNKWSSKPLKIHIARCVYLRSIGLKPGLGIRSFAHLTFSSNQMSNCERFAQISQDKWATVSESLRSLRENEQSWANRSGCSRQMSNHERCNQVVQRKWENERFAQKMLAKKI